jgi:threonine dehydrogenase-like Zn-dependent dehydrogenase
MIVGAGVVGLLVARLCARLPGAEVIVVDVAPDRAKLTDRLGLVFKTPDAAPAHCDLVFHASGNAAGLATALRCAGDEASIVELSWYGTGEVAAPLGDAFHSRRLRLISSQVGKVSPSHRPRWTPARRLRAALALLDDPVLDVLLAPAVDFTELPSRLPELLTPDGDARCALIHYRGVV